jgi:hypothetical protein
MQRQFHFLFSFGDFYFFFCLITYTGHLKDGNPCLIPDLRESFQLAATECDAMEAILGISLYSYPYLN